MKLIKLTEDKIELFISMNQESFQKGFEDYFGKTEEIIIPREDILSSLQSKGSSSYLAVLNNEIVGGVCVNINEETNINHLDILFVKVGVQSKGIGYEIYEKIEKMYPNTKIWKTCTPYFDRRNIHFYVNKCKFHVVEYVNKYYLKDNLPEDFVGDGGEGMFEFEKVM